ncbi:tRNA lysidine(34) synthetase TilS [Psychroserpens sp. XS_ASV72]|uniref:tRNA lysidine(34) synthetase TilS n=1 Tax=Psychroserpens sp. XS_ASV72 TaxID=3241293 RepID=UPI003514FAE5
MLSEFKKHIDASLPFLKEGKLLIAISGGLDSVVLTHLCKSANLNIALAHCNFKLRGEESDADEDFVLQLSEDLNLEVFIEYFDTEKYASKHKLSIQMAARELRYHWFDTMLNDLDFDCLLTAHHADDNLETFLINLTRGSGLSGLTGIPEVNNAVVRPLLPFSRAQLEAYAKQNGLQWREDSSNVSDKYLRNKLRHHIIPQLKEIAPELLSNFNTTISNLKDASDIVDDGLDALSEKAISEIDGHQIKFKISEFERFNNPKAYLYEMFKGYGFTEWNDVVDLLTAQSGKQIFSDSYRLLKDREHLILTDKANDEEADNAKKILISDDVRSIETPFGVLLFDEADSVIKSSETTVFVDKDLLDFPLHIRKWKEGDMFYPLGMKGKKKLSKYFKDEKLSLVAKEKSRLLVSDGKIVWVIGMRADDRFKVTNYTTNILKIQLIAT